MTKDVILELFKKNPNEWFTTKEIENIFDLGRATIQRRLSRLRKAGFVLFKEEAIGNFRRFIYRHKDS